MSFTRITRRGFLSASAASVMLWPLASRGQSATGGESRLVVILLRGGLDGLQLVQPYGEAGWSGLRAGLALTPETGLLDLDGFYGLDPSAASLLPLYRAGELGFVHATAGPYRNRADHFSAQNMLESGSGEGRLQRTGWLNRALALIPRSAGRRAIDVNASMELILSGATTTDSWTTQADTSLAPDEVDMLARLYSEDDGFSRTLAAAMPAAGSGNHSAIFDPQRRAAGIADMARLTGGLLRENYRIASFSIGGWDSHRDQKQLFARASADLSRAFLALKEGLGEEAWRNTSVLAVTEFGRALRLNDHGGTEHGTGSLAIIAGGAVAGGSVMGEWPGLSHDALLDGQDLAPTTDVREIAAAMLYQQFDISIGNIVSKVFPGLDFDGNSIYLRG
ncbi:DUF1501 domain-containing protein [Rhizobium oryzicola]|uniref:DUF1501 domain-containing protein n=1 Tax=Rhizobium oryzicola TaxID=1232668 RepID=A0ABT8T1Y2_9HYPH|nr:DUF1501 domain-containing protein [Rhizobium oryzicola]MDO1584667.1 DUF1501 domain-containing protein [Rhizobium oryzicola]